MEAPDFRPMACAAAAIPGYSLPVSTHRTGFARARREHFGQPIPFDFVERVAICASHSWPFSQRHQTFLLLPAITSAGMRVPFFVGCHSAASQGCVVARSLNPGSTFLLAQYGHPVALLPALSFGVACHSWPFSQRHQALRLLPAKTSLALSPPFLVGCHWAAKWGRLVARSFTPRSAVRPLQYGQPTEFRPVLLPTVASHSCHAPSSDRCLHQTFLPLPGMTSEGARVPFLVGCHCSAKSGRLVARSLNPGSTFLLAQYGHLVSCLTLLAIVASHS